MYRLPCLIKASCSVSDQTAKPRENNQAWLIMIEKSRRRSKSIDRIYGLQQWCHVLTGWCIGIGKGKCF